MLKSSRGQSNSMAGRRRLSPRVRESEPEATTAERHNGEKQILKKIKWHKKTRMVGWIES